MKNKAIKSVIICLVIAVLGVSGYYGYKKFFKSRPVAAESSYITEIANKMDMEVSIQTTGTAYAAVSRDIASNNNGELKNLTVDVGDTVKKGQKLFTSDSDQLRSELEKAENELSQLKLQSSSTSSTNVDNENGGDGNSSKSNANSANQKEIQSLSISQAESNVESAQSQVNKMTVYSPIAGVVTEKNYSNGDNVQSGQAVLSIVDPSSIKIKASVDELDISKIKVGQKAEIKFDAIENKTYEGTVEQIAFIGNNTNSVTTYDVVIGIKNPSNIKIGMNANVNILIQSKKDALVIPSEALVEKDGKKYVMVPSSENSQSSSEGDQSNNNSSNKPEMRTRYSRAGKLVEIKTGLVNEDYVEVTQGINEGQKVLITVPQSSTTNMDKNNDRNGMPEGFEGGPGGGPGVMNGGGGFQGQGSSRKGSNTNKPN